MYLRGRKEKCYDFPILILFIIFICYNLHWEFDLTLDPHRLS